VSFPGEDSGGTSQNAYPELSLPYYDAVLRGHLCELSVASDLNKIFSKCRQHRMSLSSQTIIHGVKLNNGIFSAPFFRQVQPFQQA
jgi:hypothetical protein